MYKKTKTLVGVFFLALLIPGCASSPKAPFPEAPKQSKAWNLAWPAGIKIRDQKVPKNVTKGSERGLVGGAAAGGLGYIKPPPGFSPGFGGALSALSWMTNNETMSERSRLIAWIPTSEAETAEEAAEMIRVMVEGALTQAAQEGSYRSSYKYSDTSSNITRDFTLVSAIYSGGDCTPGVLYTPEVGEVYCGILVELPSREVSTRYYKLIKTKDPNIFGGKDAWFVMGTLHRSIDDKEGDWSRSYRAGIPEVEVLMEASRRLPEWAYVYISSNYSSHYNEEEERFTYLMYPLVLHQGEPLYFIRD